MEKKNLGRISEKYKNINNVGSPVDSFADSLPESFGSTPESWKSYDLDTMSSQERYRLLISAVIPRPVALITSINQILNEKSGTFSNYQYVLNLYQGQPNLSLFVLIV